jgi:uncharacterized membrane protein YqjE
LKDFAISKSDGSGFQLNWMPLFQGNRSSIPDDGGPRIYYQRSSQEYLMLMLSGLCCVSILFIMVFFCHYRQERVVRSKGLVFLALFSIGCGCSFLSSTAFYSLANHSTCITRLLLSVLSWSFCNSSLIGRELLVAKIFNGQFRPKQKWWKLYQPTFYFFTFLFFAEMVYRLRRFYF